MPRTPGSSLSKWALLLVCWSAAHGQTINGVPGQAITGQTVTRTAAISDFAPATGDSGLILVIDPPQAITITRVYCASQGGTNVAINLDKRAEGTIATDSGNHLLSSILTAVNTGANTSTFANGAGQCGSTSSCAIAAHAPVVMTIASVSGSVTALNCSVDYTVVVN